MWVTITLKYPFFLFKFLLFCSFSVLKTLELLQNFANLKCFKLCKFYYKNKTNLFQNWKKKILFQKNNIEKGCGGTNWPRPRNGLGPASPARPKRYAAERRKTLPGGAHLSDVIFDETGPNTAEPRAVRCNWCRPNPNPSPKPPPSINTPPPPLFSLPITAARPRPRRRNRPPEARSLCELRPSLRSAPARDPRHHHHPLARCRTPHIVVDSITVGELCSDENVRSRCALARTLDAAGELATLLFSLRSIENRHPRLDLYRSGTNWSEPLRSNKI
jgi:hypothetical protein